VKFEFKDILIKFVIMKNILSLLNRESKNKINLPLDEIVFNVDNFNIWFCHKDNRAVYSNRGIFLRLDKLSESQIIDYLDKSFNIKQPDHNKVRKLYEDVRLDWLNKLNS
jgi:hypothetical protein